MKNKGFLDKCIDFLRDIVLEIIINVIAESPIICAAVIITFILLLVIKELITAFSVGGVYTFICILHYTNLGFNTKKEYRKSMNNYISNVSLPSEDRKHVEKAISKMQTTNIRQGIFFLNCFVFSVLRNNINGFTKEFNRCNTDQLRIVLWFKNTKKNVEKIKIDVLMNGELKQRKDKIKDIIYELKPQQVGKIEISYHNTLFSQLHDGKNLLTIFANDRKIVSIYIHILNQN